MTFKVFIILLGALYVLLNITAQVNIPNQSKSTNFTIHWHWENQDELLNITKTLDGVTTANEQIMKRLDKLEESNINLLKRLEKMDLPKSCNDALKYGQLSGVHKIHLRNSGLEPFNVYCLNNGTDHQPWTIIQRRQDGSVDFYRDWVQYVNGFGDATGEYWIGLKKLHKITASQPMELWVKLEDREGETRSAHYEQFLIGDESEGYNIKILGECSGDAGDSLVYHANRKFTTKDRDYDSHPDENCAVLHTGAWWYDGCYTSNLNGKYGEDSSEGVVWEGFNGYRYSLKYVHMAVRPRMNA